MFDMRSIFQPLCHFHLTAWMVSFLGFEITLENFRDVIMGQTIQNQVILKASYRFYGRI